MYYNVPCNKRMQAFKHTRARGAVNAKFHSGLHPVARDQSLSGRLVDSDFCARLGDCVANGRTILPLLLQQSLLCCCCY